MMETVKLILNLVKCVICAFFFFLQTDYKKQ